MLQSHSGGPDISGGLAEFESAAGAVLLDVRTGSEFREGHVPGSRNIELTQIDAAASVIYDKSTPIFVYCRSGARSGRAAIALKKMGYTNVKNIGGITSYAGPVETGA